MIDELVKRYGTRPFVNRRVRLFIYVVAEIWIVTVALAYFGGVGGGTASGSVTTLSAPTAPAASVSGPTATVTWSASTIGGSVAATSYNVERYSSGGTDLGTATCSPVSSSSGSPNAFGSFSCADSPAAGSYKYRVTAMYHLSWTAPSSFTSNVTVQNQTATAVSGPTTDPTSTAIPAGSISATLSNAGTGAGGTITFKVFGPQSSAPTSCSSAGTTLGAATVTGNGTYNPGAGYTPTAAGVYWWYVSYGGDANNSVSASTCGSGMASTVVKNATSSATGSVPSSGNAGSAISAGSISATLSGTTAGATGTITYSVFGPQSSAPTACTSGGTAVGTASVAGSGTYSPSSGYTPAQAGTYWWYASYSGDGGNNASNSTCGSGMASTVVGKANTSLTSAAPTTDATGTAIAAASLSATLSGSSGGSGTITFTVFGPQSSAPVTCASGGTTVGTATVSGNASYNPTAGLTPPGPGTYWWYASYSGDANNVGSSSACGASMASTVVKNTTTLTASAPAADTSGTAIAASSISSSLSGGSAVTGTVTYTVFGPQASAPSSCTSGGTTVGTSTVAGNGTYSSSAGFTPSSAGIYWWYASYNGDASNSASASACGSLMPATYVYGVSSVAGATSTSGTSVTTSSFAVQPSTTYLLLIFRHSSAGDGIGSVTTSGLSPSLSLSSFTSVASQTYGSNDYQWADWVTTSSSAGGTGTLTVNFNNTLAGGQISSVDLVALGGVNSTDPIVLGNEALSTGTNSNTATANLSYAPGSADSSLVFLTGEGKFPGTAPSGTPAMANAYYTQNGSGSVGVYRATPGTQNESFAISTSMNWGSLALELRRAGSTNTTTTAISAPATATAGRAISAGSIGATLSGATSGASNGITYAVFGPQASAPTNCSSAGTTVGGVVTVSGSGSYSPSAGFTPTQAGTYWWRATYSGDQNNLYSTSTCGSGMTSTVVSAAAPSISAGAPSAALSASAISAASITSLLSGGSSPTGTITYKVFGPQANAPTNCTTGGTTVGTSTVSANSSYSSSAPFTPSSAGQYWWYASYGGDANNSTATSTCGSSMPSTYVYAASSVASVSATTGTSATTTSFSVQPSTTYLLLVFRHSAASDSIASVSSTGLSPVLSLGSFTSIASQTYDTSKDYQWAYWITTSSSASGSGTLTVNFNNTLAGGQVSIVDLVQLGGVNTTAPVVTSNEVMSNGSSASATANLPSAPASGDLGLVLLTAEKGLGASAPTATPTMTNIFYSQSGSGSSAPYALAPGAQNESFSFTAAWWGTIGFELRHP